MTPAQIASAKQLVEWLMRSSPVCAAILLAGGIAGYIYAGQTYATTESVQELKEVFQQGFQALGARMDLSDADNLVRDLQSQVRTKEREVEDLEMVIAEMGAGDGSTVLRNRVFTARQDLGELRARLAAAEKAKESATAAYRRAEQ